MVSCGGSGSSRPNPIISQGNESSEASLPIEVSANDMPSVPRSFPKVPSDGMVGGIPESAIVTVGSLPRPIEMGGGGTAGEEKGRGALFVAKLFAVGFGCCSGGSWPLSSVSTCSVFTRMVSVVFRLDRGRAGTMVRRHT